MLVCVKVQLLIFWYTFSETTLQVKKTLAVGELEVKIFKTL